MSSADAIAAAAAGVATAAPCCALRAVLDVLDDKFAVAPVSRRVNNLLLRYRNHPDAQLPDELSIIVCRSCLETVAEVCSCQNGIGRSLELQRDARSYGGLDVGLRGNGEQFDSGRWISWSCRPVAAFSLHPDVQRL